MGLFLRRSENGALVLLGEVFLRCPGLRRRVGLSVCRGAAVCRKRGPGVGSLCRQLLRVCHFAFASLPRTCSTRQSRQPGRPTSPFLLRVICRSLALPAASLAACTMLILRTGEVLSAAGSRPGAVSRRRGLFIRLLAGQSFGSSRLRRIDGFYRTRGLVHHSGPAAVVPGGVNATPRITRQAGHLKSFRGRPPRWGGGLPRTVPGERALLSPRSSLLRAADGASSLARELDVVSRRCAPAPSVRLRFFA